MRWAAAIAALALLVGCATGNPDWRRRATASVEWSWVGDGRCSDPAPYTSLVACMAHDSAYETARLARCNGWDPELHSEQARLEADADLARQMARDGVPELWVSVYYVAVRLGGWRSWHFGGCDG